MIWGPDGRGRDLAAVQQTQANASAQASSKAPPTAQEVAAAYQAVIKSLGKEPVDQATLKATLQAVSGYRALSQAALARAMLLVQAQYDAQRRAAGQAPPKDALAQAAAEVARDGVFDPATVARALQSLQAGQVPSAPELSVANYSAMAPCMAGQASTPVLPKLSAPAAPTLSQASAQLNNNLSGGMSLQEAVVAARIQYGGGAAVEPTLAEAALAHQAPAFVGQYETNQQGADPTQLAAAQLATLKLFSPAALAQAGSAMTVQLANPRPAGSAAEAAATTLQHDQAASASAQRIAGDMLAYRATLQDELDAAAGKNGSAWETDAGDPARIDRWLKAEVAVADVNLAPPVRAAQGTAANSTANKALEADAQNLQQALDETQAIAQVTNTTAAGAAGPAGTDLAQALQLTNVLGGMGLLARNGQPISDDAASSAKNPGAAQSCLDIMSDPAIQELAAAARGDVLQGAGPRTSLAAPQAAGDLRAVSGVLAEYQGTAFYKQLLSSTTRSPAVQQRFTDLLNSVHADTAPDVVHAQVALLQSVSTPADQDLTDALFQRFQGGFLNSISRDTWTAPGLFTNGNQAAQYATDVAAAYRLLGGNKTAAARAVEAAVRARMDGGNFVGRADYTSLTPNGPQQNVKRYYLNVMKGQGGDPQLFVDIAESEAAQPQPHLDTARFIDAELGLSSATPLGAAKLPAFVAPGSEPMPTGTVIVSSREQLINALGRAYQQTPLAPAQAGQADYDGNDVVYGTTTLNDMANAALASQGMRRAADLSAQTPLELTFLPLQYWNQNQDPSRDAARQSQLLQVDGAAAARRYVGPAGARVYSSYQDWLNASGFAPGLLLSQQQTVTDAAGQMLQMWDQTVTGPKQSWQGAFLQASEVLLSIGAIGVTTFVDPLADGFWLPLISELSQASFAIPAAFNIKDLVVQIAQNPGSQNWLADSWTLAADTFMDLSTLGDLALTRMPDFLERGLAASHGLQQGAEVGWGARVLARATDNAAGTRLYMGLAGAPDPLLKTLAMTQRGTALTNGVLLAAQGGQMALTLVNGRNVAPGALLQFLAPVGMARIGKVFGWQRIGARSASGVPGDAELLAMTAAYRETPLQPDVDQAAARAANEPTVPPFDPAAAAPELDGPAAQAGHLSVLQAYWSQCADIVEAARTRPDMSGAQALEAVSALASDEVEQAWRHLPSAWHLHRPSSLPAQIRFALGDESRAPDTASQLALAANQCTGAQGLVRMASLDLADEQRPGSGFDAYGLTRVLYEQRFNGSRPGNTFHRERTDDGSLGFVQRMWRRGDTPFWDLDDDRIAAAGACLTTYGDSGDSPLRTADGKVRVWLHYLEIDDLARMTAKFGPPSGSRPALMTSSLRTLQVRTPHGWHQIKFSMPARPQLGTYRPAEKDMQPSRDVHTAVQASNALDASPGFARERTGLSLDLGDGARPIGQLCRALPAATRGYREGDFTAPMHVFTAPEFAATPHGERIFALYGEAGEAGHSPQEQWLRKELVPSLSRLLWRTLSEEHVHLVLHEQNIDLITDAHGHLIDIVVKDLADLKPDRRGLLASGKAERWPDLDAMRDDGSGPVFNRLYGLDDEDDFAKQSAAYTNFYQLYMSQLGSRLGGAEDDDFSFIFPAAVDGLIALAKTHLPAAWLNAQRGLGAYGVAFNLHASQPPAGRIAALRELLIRVAEDPSGGTSVS